jgi:hypothetical protein
MESISLIEPAKSLLASEMESKVDAACSAGAGAEFRYQSQTMSQTELARAHEKPDRTITQRQPSARLLRTGHNALTGQHRWRNGNMLIDAIGGRCGN